MPAGAAWTSERVRERRTGRRQPHGRGARQRAASGRPGIGADMQDRESRPAPSPEEVADASTSPHGSWAAKQLRDWGVPWPPPAGWRKELARKHAAGEEVVPLRLFGKPAES